MGFKIFQAPVEIAGQMGLQAIGLQQRGHQVDSFNIDHNYLGYHRGINNMTLDQLVHQFDAVKDCYDVFHFHYGVSMNGDMDFQYAAEHNKTRLMHFWGNDVRTREAAAVHNPYSRLISEYLDKDKIQSRLLEIARYIPACIVQDFEVADYVRRYFDRIYVLPITFDTASVQPIYRDANDVPLIIHAPTQSYFKGTDYIEETLEKLKVEGLRFHYKKIHGLTNEEALQLYQHAHIVIDQIYNGTHGLFAVEAMAMGKPVISYIREDLKYWYPPELPIVSASPAQLYSKLKSLLQQPHTWNSIGRAGRQYVSTYHDMKVTAAHLEWIYQRERAILDGRLKSSPQVIYCLGLNQFQYPIIGDRHISRHCILLDSIVPIEERQTSYLLKPNRYYVRKGSKKRIPISYFSFNLAEIPSDIEINKAVLKLPITRGTTPTKIHRIAQGWSKKSIRKRKPKRKPKPITVLPKARKRKIKPTLEWECTDLAKLWQNDQLGNHGLVVHKRIWKTPHLVIQGRRKL